MDLTGVGGFAGMLVQICYWLKVSSKRLWSFVEKEFLWRFEGYPNVAGKVSVRHLSEAVSREEPCIHLPIGARVIGANPSYA